MTAILPTYLRGLGLPAPGRTLWQAQSGYYDAGGSRLSALSGLTATPTTPEPAQRTDLALSGHGEPTGTIYAVASRGGLPGEDEAGLLWSDVSASSTLRGCDLPTLCSRFAVLHSTGTRRTPHIVALGDGSALACWYQSGTGTCVERISVAGVPGAEVTVTGDGGSNPYACLMVVPASDDDAYPRVHLYQYRYLSASETQIHLYSSDDLGATWTDRGDVLDVPIDMTVYPAIDRIRAVYLHGQVLLVLWAHLPVGSGTYPRDCLLQYASATGGHTLSLVVAWDPTGLSGGLQERQTGACPDLCVLDDVAYLAWLGFTDSWPFAITRRTVLLARLTTATEYSHQIPYILPTAGAADNLWTMSVGLEIEDGELALWACDDGSLCLTTRDVSDGYWLVLRSPDAGATLYRTGPSARSSGAQQWYDADSIAETPEQLSCCEVRGRALAVHSWVTGAALSGHIAVSQLGGWTTETLPHLTGSTAPTYRTAYELTWCGWCDPTAVWWTRTAGAGGAVVSDRYVVGAGDQYQETGMVGSVAAGMVVESQQEIATIVLLTPTVIRVRIGDGASSYEVEARIGRTQTLLWDVVAGAQVGVTLTRAGTGVFRVRLAVAGASARLELMELSGLPEDRVWTLVASTSTLTAGGASSHRIQVDWAAADTWDWCGYSSGAYTGDQLTSAPTRLTLYPRSLPAASPVYLGDGWSASAVTGPAAAGDSWTLTPSYEYPPEAMDPASEEDGRHASPRWGWRSPLIADLPVGTATIRASWYLSSGGDVAVPDLWYLRAERAILPSTSVYVRTGGAWYLVGTVASLTVRMDAGQDVLTTSSTGASVASNWRRDELAGSVVYTPGGGGAVETILEHEPGTTRTGAALPLRLRLDAVPPGAGAQNCVIWPSRWLVVLSLGRIAAVLGGGLSLASIQGIQLRWTVAAPYPPSTYQIGSLALGPVLAWGHQYGRGRSISARSRTVLEEAEDGSVLVGVRGPTSREWELSWPDGVGSTDSHAAAPDYVVAYSGGSALTWRRSTAADVLDTLSALDGSAAPVVYLPSIPTADLVSTGMATYYDRWARGSALCRLSGLVSIDAELGEEEVDEVLRVQSVTLTEIP